MLMDTDMENISVHIIDFKGAGVDEQVILNQDGSYTILIDARASYEAQAAAYEHAMSHIRNGDFQKNDVQQIEAAAHGIDAPAVEQIRAISKMRIWDPKNTSGILYGIRLSDSTMDKINAKIKELFVFEKNST